MLDPKSMKPAQSYQVGFEVAVRAARERAWQGLTTEIGHWWPRHFFTHPNPAGFVLEPGLGGRVYEDWGGGAGVLWGTVVVWVPGQRMTWACEMYPDWSGPGRSFVTFTLEDRGLETIVKVEDAGICINAHQAASSLNNGWHELIGVHFKSYVESATWSAPPALGDPGLMAMRYGDVGKTDDL
ncbi:hypothetical protein BH11PLA2_BH11PLA2_11580 [soil metagenome]